MACLHSSLLHHSIQIRDHRGTTHVHLIVNGHRLASASLPTEEAYTQLSLKFHSLALVDLVMDMAKQHFDTEHPHVEWSGKAYGASR